MICFVKSDNFIEHNPPYNEQIKRCQEFLWKLQELGQIC